jgi:hypothetical protein
MRIFLSKATRDTNKGKISYYGFRHPLVEHSFGKYMLRHQKQANGKLRSPFNWWGGWSEDISIDSLTRHTADLEALHAGLFVYKVRDKGEETVILPYSYEKTFKKSLPKNWTKINKEEVLNAIKFNCNAYLLKLLYDKKTNK